jgi:hypothetical protein
MAVGRKKGKWGDEKLVDLYGCFISLKPSLHRHPDCRSNHLRDFKKSRTITHSPTLITRCHSLLMYLSIQGFSLRHMHYLMHSFEDNFLSILHF